MKNKTEEQKLQDYMNSLTPAERKIAERANQLFAKSFAGLVAILAKATTDNLIVAVGMAACGQIEQNPPLQLMKAMAINLKPNESAEIRTWANQAAVEDGIAIGGSN